MVHNLHKQLYHQLANLRYVLNLHYHSIGAQGLDYVMHNMGYVCGHARPLGTNGVRHWPVSHFALLS